MAEDTTIDTKSLKSLVSWYYTQFLIQPRGLDNNSLWLVTIYPQDANLLGFIDMIQTEAARFDVNVKAVGNDGIPGGYSGSTMGKMVDRAWLANVLPLGDQATNLDGWGASNVLASVVDVTLPPDNIATKAVDLGPGYTWVPPILADKHSKFNPLALTFYYTTYPFSEFIIRPWSMAINRWGLKLAKLRCNMVLTLFSRTNQWKHPNGRDWVHKYDYRFYGCYPLGVPNLRFDYKDSAQDKTVTVQFGYDFYRIDPEPGYPAYQAKEILNGKLDLSNVVKDIKVNDGYNDEPTEASIDVINSFRMVDPDDYIPKGFTVPDAVTVNKNDEIPKNVHYNVEEKAQADKADIVDTEWMKFDYGIADLVTEDMGEIFGTASEDEPPDNFDEVTKSKLWLDTPILPLTLVFKPKRNDEPNRIASNDIRPGGDEPGKIDSRVSEKIDSDEVQSLGDVSIVLDDVDEVKSLDDSTIALFDEDEPSEAGVEFLTVDADDEYRNVDIPILTLDDDEPILNSRGFDKLPDDEPTKLSSNVIQINDEDGLSKIKNAAKIDDDEIGRMHNAGMPIPHDDEVNGKRFNPKSIAAGDVEKVPSNAQTVVSNEPLPSLPESISLENDEVKSVSLPVISVSTDDEVKVARSPRTIEATGDEP